jgi:hypothetical protein
MTGNYLIEVKINDIFYEAEIIDITESYLEIKYLSVNDLINKYIFYLFYEQRKSSH